VSRIVLVRHGHVEALSAYVRVGQDPGALSEIELLEYGATVHRLNESCS